MGLNKFNKTITVETFFATCDVCHDAMYELSATSTRDEIELIKIEPDKKAQFQRGDYRIRSYGEAMFKQELAATGWVSEILHGKAFIVCVKCKEKKP